MRQGIPATAIAQYMLENKQYLYILSIFHSYRIYTEQQLQYHIYKCKACIFVLSGAILICAIEQIVQEVL